AWPRNDRCCMAAILTGCSLFKRRGRRSLPHRSLHCACVPRGPGLGPHLQTTELLEACLDTCLSAAVLPREVADGATLAERREEAAVLLLAPQLAGVARHPCARPGPSPRTLLERANRHEQCAHDGRRLVGAVHREHFTRERVDAVGERRND